MAQHVLPADTLISALMPSGGGSLASGDTIELSGHNLIIDADAVSYPASLTNGGATAHLELRDGGRIKLNATLPTSICPWVDPENPLPADFENESAYITGLTANARAEISFASLVDYSGFGGGHAYLPTKTRSGYFWAKSISSPTSTSIVFDRNIPLHAGDIIANVTGTRQLLTVSSYDASSFKATVTATITDRSAGKAWCLASGGVVITFPAGNRRDFLTRDVRCGTLNLLGIGLSGLSETWGAGQGVSVIADRLTWFPSTNTAERALGFTCGANVVAKQVGCYGFAGVRENGTVIWSDNALSGRSDVGELVCSFMFGAQSRRCFYGNWDVGGGYISTPGRMFGGVNLKIKNAELGTSFELVGQENAVEKDNCIVAGQIVSSTQFETSGTVSRVARSSFPVDTDLPDAFYHAPATAADVPWRYEDYWVRKGETLRIACRAMRGGDNGAARVAIGEMGVWVPAAGMPTLAEWTLDSGEPLVWRGGQIQWTNDTDEDRQVRVWSMGSGINGAYISVWRANGGAM